MNDRFGLLAVAALFVWTMTTWRGGVVLVREVGRCFRARRLFEGALIVAGVSANLLNIIYEIARRRWALPSYSLNLPLPVRIAGLVLFLIGFASAMRARYILGASWTVMPQSPAAGLRITGLYKIVRHPIYAAATAVYVGLALAQSDLPGVLVFGAQIAGFIIKAEREDRLLGSAMPAEYAAYRRTVRWRMFPGLWSM
jgi:protein-S-isoprenylcysteine O-methyltransferase Ste14